MMFARTSLRGARATHIQHARALSMATIDPSAIEITRTSSPKTKLPNEELSFGSTFSDHMLEIDWDHENGWHKPKISPYGALQIDPAATSLHYGLQCFEGMKCYLDDEDNIRMFRPDMNMKRMNNSMKRLFLPEFDGDAFVECIAELCRVDKDWIPKGEGYSMYIRPTGIATHPFLGVGAAQQAKLYAILSPVGPYYPEGFAAVSLLAGDEYVRAWPGGTGDSKVGGNYGPTILPQMEAAKKGYSQVLWLFGEDHQVTEVGTMNLFLMWEKPGGGKELVTAPLSRGDILPGVTRDCVLDLARKWGDCEVSERNVTMAEVVSAVDEGRIIEAFGCGTAAVLSPIKLVHYNGRDLEFPLANGQSGDMCQRLWNEITGIQYGKIEHPWSIKID